MQNTHMYTLAAALVLSACGGASLTMPGGTTEMASGLPHCDLPVGTVALTQEEDADKAERAKYDLPSPLPLLEVMIHQSNCFQLVARGSIIDAIKAEQVLGGQSQLVAADYYIKPKITFFLTPSRAAR